MAVKKVRNEQITILPAQSGTKFVFVDKRGQVKVLGNVVAFEVETSFDNIGNVPVWTVVSAKGLIFQNESMGYKFHTGVMFPDGTIDSLNDGCFESISDYQEFLKDIPPEIY